MKWLKSLIKKNFELCESYEEISLSLIGESVEVAPLKKLMTAIKSLKVDSKTMKFVHESQIFG